MEKALFENNLLADRNKCYTHKKPFFLKFLGFLLYFFAFILLCSIIFGTIFIKAQVVGISMIPTYNRNLDATVVESNEYYENSPYKDVVFANRFEKGTNGDVILLKLNNELVIKRVIAMEGQKVTLKLGNGSGDDTNFYYYVNDVLVNEPYIYSREDMDINYFKRFCLGDSAVERNMEVTLVLPGVEAEFVVPQGEYFVLGDNRLVSGDSVRYGTVNKSNIFGKVAFSYEYNQTFLGFIWQKICSIF